MYYKVQCTTILQRNVKSWTLKSQVVMNFEDSRQEEFQHVNELRIAKNFASDHCSLFGFRQEILGICVFAIFDHHHRYDRANSDKTLVGLSRDLSLDIVERWNFTEFQKVQGRRQGLMIKFNQLIEMSLVNVEVARRVEKVIKVDARAPPETFLVVNLKEKH